MGSLAMSQGRRRVLFAFPPFHGHLNPSLPVARALVESGHDVHYFSSEAVRSKIEATGAMFHSVAAWQPELYGARDTLSPLGPLEVVMEELDLDKAAFISQLLILNVVLEMQLPGALRFLKRLQPDVIVYDGLLRGRDVQFAAQLLGIPAVNLFTLAGPGAWLGHSPATMPVTMEEAHQIVENFEPNVLATKRINATYRLELSAGLPQPTGKMDTFGSNTVLITTSEDLQDPLPASLASAYAKDGASLAFVGPLLESVGSQASDSDGVMRRARLARQQGRPVVLVSMGTLLVSDHSLNGWNARSGGKRSLSGRQLCQAAWAGACKAFGNSSEDAGPLVLVACGPQPDALEGLHVPANVVFASALPQVDLLREGVDLFLTHGGQNSFTEAMMYATPVVVCPGFGDQKVNAQKALDLGVGQKVDRPEAPTVADEQSVAVGYCDDVCVALLEVQGRASYKAAAKKCQQNLRATGGVARAVELILAARAAGGVKEGEEDFASASGALGAPSLVGS